MGQFCVNICCFVNVFVKIGVCKGQRFIENTTKRGMVSRANGLWRKQFFFSFRRNVLIFLFLILSKLWRSFLLDSVFVSQKIWGAKSCEWVTVIDDTRMILLAHIIQTKDISEPHPCYGSRPVDRLANAMIEAVESHRHSIKSNACLFESIAIPIVAVNWTVFNHWTHWI